MLPKSHPELQGPGFSLSIKSHCLAEYCLARSWKKASHLVPGTLTLLIDTSTTVIATNRGDLTTVHNPAMHKLIPIAVKE